MEFYSADIEMLMSEVEQPVVGEFGRDISVASGDIDGSISAALREEIRAAQAAAEEAKDAAYARWDADRFPDLSKVDIAPGCRFRDSSLHDIDRSYS
jgi:hypothetical protein